MTPTTVRKLWGHYRSTRLAQEATVQEIERARGAFLAGMLALTEVLNEMAGRGETRELLQAVIQATATLRTMRAGVPSRSH